MRVLFHVLLKLLKIWAAVRRDGPALCPAEAYHRLLSLFMQCACLESCFG